ncbi:MAG: hypothetical protein NT157_01150, partial [Candidatus Micrarchaeota archaeon]|nr:hypothetical protein [Candidatus Micrarchaeota archaeon]
MKLLTILAFGILAVVLLSLFGCATQFTPKPPSPYDEGDHGGETPPAGENGSGEVTPETTPQEETPPEAKPRELKTAGMESTLKFERNADLIEGYQA